MLDTIIKGSGNSRGLRSAIAENMSWEQFREALRSGVLPVDLGALNDDGLVQRGTPLSKATLLSDANAAKFWPTPTGEETPDAALGLLGEDMFFLPSFTELDDIQLEAGSATVTNGWTTITFARLFDGPPRVYLSYEDATNTYLPQLANVTASSFQARLVQLSTTTSSNYLTAVTWANLTGSFKISYLAVYNGGEA